MDPGNQTQVLLGVGAWCHDPQPSSPADEDGLGHELHTMLFALLDQQSARNSGSQSSATASSDLSMANSDSDSSDGSLRNRQTSRVRSREQSPPDAATTTSTDGGRAPGHNTEIMARYLHDHRGRERRGHHLVGGAAEMHPAHSSSVQYAGGGHRIAVPEHDPLTALAVPSLRPGTPPLGELGLAADSASGDPDAISPGEEREMLIAEMRSTRSTFPQHPRKPTNRRIRKLSRKKTGM